MDLLSCQTPKTSDVGENACLKAVDEKKETAPLLMHADDELSAEPSVDSDEKTTLKPQVAEAQGTMENLTSPSMGDDVMDLERGVEQEQAETLLPLSLIPTQPHLGARPEKKTYSCSECGKEYASRSGLKGHMKHHGGAAVKPSRAPSRSTRFSSERPSASATSIPVAAQPSPSTRASVNFWNQYQAFLNTSTGVPSEDVASSNGSHSQGGLDITQLSDSPNQSQMMMEIGSLDNDDVSEG